MDSDWNPVKPILLEPPNQVTTFWVRESYMTIFHQCRVLEVGHVYRLEV